MIVGRDPDEWPWAWAWALIEGGPSQACMGTYLYTARHLNANRIRVAV